MSRQSIVKVVDVDVVDKLSLIELILMNPDKPSLILLLVPRPINGLSLKNQLIKPYTQQQLTLKISELENDIVNVKTQKIYDNWIQNLSTPSNTNKTWFDQIKDKLMFSEQELDLLLKFNGKFKNPNIYHSSYYFTLSEADQRDLWQYQKDKKIFGRILKNY